MHTSMPEWLEHLKPGLPRDGGGPVANDRIELWTLLQQVWAEVEPLAIARPVRVRITTDVEQRDLAALMNRRRRVGHPSPAGA